jgi:LuxR family maltose regulon positive regulatory protein
VAKLIRPILADVFLRKRLFFLLDQMRKQPAIWVSGPAGCGKTTLVNSYLEAREIPCLWYEVDEGDADLATFFYYLGQAAKKAAPRKRNSLPLLTPEYLQDIPTFTKRFFEKLYERFQLPGVVVFDNYQEVSPVSPFHEAILKGVSNLPSGMNAILISRGSPPSALIRLRANHLMQILAFKDLRLTIEESAGIARLRSKQKLSKETIAELHKGADGWAAGLVLMLERAKIEDIAPQKAGTGRPDEIFEYFASEIFDRTDKKAQDFLLKTSILPKMTARMAEQLSGSSSAGRLLSALSRNNYFTEKRFYSEPVYQYHPLFREFLLSRAKEIFPQESLSALFRTAASLLERDGQIEAAVTLLHETGDHGGIVSFILKHAPSMAAQGRYRQLEGWMSTLPEEVIKENPWLLYWMGICRLPFSPSQSQPYFEEAYQNFNSQRNIAGIIQACSGMVDSIINMAADFSSLDRWISVLEEVGGAFKEFPTEELELLLASNMFSALVYRQPQHPEIERWVNRALSLAEGSSNLILKCQTIFAEAYYRVQTGDFEKALLGIHSLKKMVESKESVPLIQIRLGFLEAAYCRYAGLHERCLKAVSDTLKLSRMTGIRAFDAHILCHGVRSALLMDDYKTASNLLEEMGSSLSSSRPGPAANYHNAKTQEALFRGDLEQATYHVERATKLRIEAGYTMLTGWCHILNAYVMHALERHREASELLAQAVEFGRKVRGPINEYAALLAEALFAFDQGRKESGLVLLKKAFAFGKERGYFGSWGPLPPGMAKLCIRALQAGIEVEYAQEVIRRLHLIPDPSVIHLESWPWPVKIYTLGRFGLFRDGKPEVFSRKVQRKPLEMLKVMVALGGKEVKEENVSDALWPEADGDDAHNSFITTQHRLRQLIGHESAIRHKEGRLTLDERHCWVDVWAFEWLLEEAEAEKERGSTDQAAQCIEKAIHLYKGPFLANEVEHSWMISARERLRSRFIRNLIWLGHYWQDQKEWEKAIESYQRGLEIDDVAEDLYQQLMICYRETGQRTEALSTYQRCRKTLSNILGVDPSPKTEAIFKNLDLSVKVQVSIRS